MNRKDLNSIKHFMVPKNKIVERAYEVDFEIKQEIGRGASGVCRIVKVPNAHKFFVAKVIDQNQEDGDKKYLFNEIQLQANLKHKNIVALEKVYIDRGHFTLITEFCFYGCLDDLICNKGHILGTSEKKHLLHGILNGARYLHNKRIVHGDIKPLNVFVTKGLQPKLGDFGLAHYIKDEDCFGGTLNYYAPEMFKVEDEKHTTKTDVWAIGCTAFFIFTGENLFNQRTNDHTPQVKRMVCHDFRNSTWYKLPGKMRSFIDLMTKKNPNLRPECSVLLLHPILRPKSKRKVSCEVLEQLSDCIILPQNCDNPFDKLGNTQCQNSTNLIM